MEKVTKSILEMKGGAFIELTDYEMSSVIKNIMDPNTKATAKRKITVTMELVPDDTRTNVAVSFSVKSALAATNPAVTSLFIAGENTDGEMQIVENTPQIPGQMDVDGVEQSAPPMLRLVKIS